MHRSDRQAAVGAWSRKAPAEKGMVGGLFLLLAISLPAPGGACVAVVATALLLLAAQVPPIAIARAAAAPVAFLLLASLAVMTTITLEDAALPVARFDGRAGWDALQRGAGGLMAMLLVVLTTRIPDLLRLLQAVGLPAPIGELGLAMYRMVWVLYDQYRRGRIALLVRGSALGWRARWRGVVLLAVAMFGRAMRRGVRMDLGERLRTPMGRPVVRAQSPAMEAGGIVVALAWGTAPLLAYLALTGWR